MSRVLLLCAGTPTDLGNCWTKKFQLVGERTYARAGSVHIKILLPSVRRKRWDRKGGRGGEATRAGECAGLSIHFHPSIIWTSSTSHPGIKLSCGYTVKYIPNAFAAKERLAFFLCVCVGAPNELTHYLHWTCHGWPERRKKEVNCRWRVSAKP